MITDKQKHNLVVKSNRIIEARYKLTVLEQKIILYLISLIRTNDEEFQPYKIKVKELANFLGIKGKYFYEKIDAATARLLTRVLRISDGKSLLQVSWLSSAEYFKGCVELCFDPKLKPYLLQLKSHFTKYKLKNVIQFSSIYSFRIYELLKQFEGIGVRRFQLELLKEILEISPTQYYRYNDFKKYVLLKAKKELEDHADIRFDFKEIKLGRMVNEIEFIILQSNRPLPFPESEQEKKDEFEHYTEYTEKLIFYGIRSKKALELLLQFPIDQIVKNVEYFEKLIAEKREFKNPAGFLYDAILKDYASLSPYELKEHKNKKEQDKIYEAYKLYKEKSDEFTDILMKKVLRTFESLPIKKQNEIKENYLKIAGHIIQRHFEKVGVDKLKDQRGFVHHLICDTDLIKKKDKDFSKYIKEFGYKIKEDSETRMPILFKIG